MAAVWLRFAPATYTFPIWKKLTEKGQGRQLLNVIDLAVLRFPEYG